MINYVDEINGLVAQQSEKITNRLAIQALSPEGQVLVVRDFHIIDNVLTLWLGDPNDIL